MTFLFPQWPAALDVMPFIQDETTAVSSLWINYAQTLVETLEAEIGVSFTGLNLSLSEIFDSIITNGAGPFSLQTRFVGVTLAIITQTGAVWGSQTANVTFQSAGQQYEPPNINDAIYFAEPINPSGPGQTAFDFALDLAPIGRPTLPTNQLVADAMGWGNLGPPGLNTAIDISLTGSNTYTFRVLKLSMPQLA